MGIMNKFTMRHDYVGHFYGDRTTPLSVEVSVNLPGEHSLDEIVECFKTFLTGIGYQPETIAEIFAVDE